MTVVAVLAALLPLIPWATRMIALLIFCCWAPVCIGTLAIYSRGYYRTFFGAALFGLLPLTVLVGRGFWDWTDILLFPVVEGLAIVSCGTIAVAARRWVERRGWDREGNADEAR
jgi:hypothetical protein